MIWNSPHYHIAINHFPIMAVPIFFVILLMGYLKKNTTLENTAYVGFIVTALFTIPTAFTGFVASDTIIMEFTNAESYIDLHRNSALISGVVMVALGIMSAVAIFKYRDRSRDSIDLASLAVSVVLVGVLAWTAERGGAINHPEVLTDPKAFYKSENKPGLSSTEKVDVPEQAQQDSP